MSLVSFSTTQITSFKTAFEAINSFVSDVNFEFSKDGITIRDIDKTGKILISAFFDAQKFDSYVYDFTDEKTCIGVAIDTIVNSIKSNLIYDVLNFRFENIKKMQPTISITLYSKERNENKTCYIKLATVIPNNNTISELQYNARATISPITFTKFIKDLNHVCDVITIKLSKENLIFEGWGENRLVISQNIKKSSSLEIIYDDDIQIRSINKTVLVKYLILLNKCINLSQEVSIYLSNENPLLVEYPLASLGLLRLAITA
jgi:proliferating cell nuclear antigen